MIYEYRCRKCGKVIEELVNDYKVNEIQCENCGSMAYRIPSSFGFNSNHLKMTREHEAYVTRKE